MSLIIYYSLLLPTDYLLIAHRLRSYFYAPHLLRFPGIFLYHNSSFLFQILREWFATIIIGKEEFHMHFAEFGTKIKTVIDCFCCLFVCLLLIWYGRSGFGLTVVKPKPNQLL